ncbi:MAG TPA: 23S rRNA (uracil(1939)-C(5))-methyltransferase RlmD [Oligoflexus sp.]|uniref:23S rRNA (uracil(1939)-C(5))-methyltransferase RlmD n=1 Tax=Oligoflexus sp. TaxID=1971216 RepID=UPI002D36A135|nr:23S rRNA (uracil(1939)-C(5))-methyltransferase RlmD [Oligoflexus sp.]HYX34621.1 23S rRNA (uracil(1939)-C(5))-methyltransferase RlmD [Oligoflexus sp.]
MKAACRFFGKCSGCSLQQFPYVKQLFDKTRLVRQQLGRFVPAGKNPDEVIHPVVPSPAEFGYRTSSKLCLSEDELGRRSMGLYARGTKKVVDIPGCPIHHTAINKLVQRLFGPGQPIPAPFYQHSRKGFQPGRLKFLTVRYSPEGESFGLILSHTGVPRADLEAWAQKLRMPHLSLYESLLSREDEDLVISRDVKYLAGDPVFTYVLDGRRYPLDPMAFFQANSSLVTTFIQHIVEGLAGDQLLDLYGGFGTYTMAAASSFQKIHLVEANPHATEAASKVAREAGLTQVQCSAASVEDVLKKLLKGSAAQQVTHMIVNPPRGGLSPQVLTALSQSGWQRLQRLHYVSCNMETLQRDLQVLTRQGFEVESITPFDMFPQTEHIELVAKLRYRGAQKANPSRAFIAPTRVFSRADKGLKSSRRPQIRS